MLGEGLGTDGQTGGSHRMRSLAQSRDRAVEHAPVHGLGLLAHQFGIEGQQSGQQAVASLRIQSLQPGQCIDRELRAQPRSQ